MHNGEMKAVVALLRGINVGGHNKLPMAQLREIAADCGFDGARTYVQSGNLVLPDVPGAIEEVAPTLTDAIRRATRLDVPVIARTASAWTDVVAANPFIAAADEGRTLHVVFLAGAASAAVRGFDASRFAPEELVVSETEILLRVPNGIGHSKLAQAVMRLDNANSGTVRNWNTVLAIAALL